MKTLQTCPACGGTGKVILGDWMLFMEVFAKSGGGSPALQVKLEQAYFRDKGYDQVPDVYVTCDVCEGALVVEGEISEEDYVGLPAATASRLGLQVDNKPGMGAVSEGAAWQTDQEAYSGLSKSAGKGTL